MLRVGLATDLETVKLPCCAPKVTVALGEGSWKLDTAITIEPALR